MMKLIKEMNELAFLWNKTHVTRKTGIHFIPVALPHVRDLGVCDAMLDSSIVQEVEQVLHGCWERAVDVKNRLKHVINILLQRALHAHSNTRRYDSLFNNMCSSVIYIFIHHNNSKWKKTEKQTEQKLN